MAEVPRDRSPDSTAALLAEGYRFVSRRSQRYRSDAFRTRLMLQRVICTLGEEAARLFYQPDAFTRRGALPITTLMLLQGRGSVQQLDGEAHRHRKQMFMSMMTPERIRELVDLMAQEWHARLEQWEHRQQVVLHDELQEILCRAVARWMGIPLPESEARRRTREFAAMIEHAGTFGPRVIWALLLRARTERWMRAIVTGIRNGQLDIPQGCPAHIIVWHRDLDGRLLEVPIAAIEIINILRPTVAVAYFITFAAHAMHEHPECRSRLETGDDDYLEMFVQEVRRFYPFFPLIGGKALRAFELRGQRFPRGTWLLLDLYGTNHDGRIWETPEQFRPERFQGWHSSGFDLIPQGAGDHYTTHRCPGEWITLELMKEAVRLLTRSIRYDVPEQDLNIDLSRFPTLPRSRFVISNIRRTSV